MGEPQLGFGLAPVEVPHLHRVSPDGRWLASFDPAGKLALRRVDVAAPQDAARTRAIRVDGVSGEVRTLRWSADGTGLIFQTAKGLFAATPADDATRTTARAIFLAASHSLTQIDDFRILPNGLIVRGNQRLFFVGSATSSTQDLTPAGYRVMAANVRSEGRIVMVVTPSEASINSGQLWTLAPSGDGFSVVHQLPCHTNCLVRNWAPGSALLTFSATSGRVTGEVEVEVDGRSTLTDAAVDKDGSRSPVHSLWADDETGRVLAATRSTVSVFDTRLKRQWAWQPDSGAIRTARFAPGGAAVIVTTADDILRVEQGVSRSLLTAAMHKRLNTGRQSAFLDDAALHPDGSLSFAVVDQTTRRDRVRPLIPRMDLLLEPPKKTD